MRIASVTSITNNINIRNKLILSYVLVVFLPVLTVGLLLTNSLREQSIDHAVQQSMNNVEKIRRQVEEMLKIPTDISYTIYFDEQLKSILDKQYATDLDVYQAYRDYAAFTNYKVLYQEIAGIRIYSSNETLLENWSIFRLDEEVRTALWFQQTRDNRGRIGWHYIADPTRKDAKYLSLARQIFSKDMRMIGILVMTVNPQKLQSILSEEPFETMIITEQNDIIVTTNPARVGEKLPLELSLHNAGGKLAESESSYYQGKEVKTVVHSISLANSDDRLRIVSVIPLDAILMNARAISNIAYVIIGSSLLLSTLMILYFSGMLSKRINILSRDIRRVALGDLSRRSVVQGMDEVGQLSRHFNFMVGSIENLLEQVSEGQRQQHALLHKHDQMKFRMLANQVNPHFLFNVLETVRMKAHVQEEHEIANTVKALGNLLRHSLELGQEPVPLTQEMELVRMYLEIQHFRFGNKLAYRLPDAAEAEGIVVLPMLLQPIVENAIVHGIENKLGRGLVCVSIHKEQQSVRIEVSDNGNGIEPSHLREIEASLADEEDRPAARIGLRNVHHRTQLYYGEDYGVHVSSERGAGTTVAIRLPGTERGEKDV
jgi:two-component system, sensor histidine kinase YesM